MKHQKQIIGSENGIDDLIIAEIIEIDYWVAGSYLHGEIIFEGRTETVEMSLKDVCELANVETKGLPITAMGEENKILVLVERHNSLTGEDDSYYREAGLQEIIDGMSTEEIEKVIKLSYSELEKTVAA